MKCKQHPWEILPEHGGCISCRIHAQVAEYSSQDELASFVSMGKVVTVKRKYKPGLWERLRSRGRG